MIHSVWLTVLVCAVISFNSFAQTSAIRDVQIILESNIGPYEGLSESFMENMTEEQSDSLVHEYYNSETFETKVGIFLNDSTDVQQIHVKLGRTEGGNDLFEGTLNADGSSLPSGVTYFERPRYFRFGFGQFTNVSDVYCEVYLVDSNGLESIHFLKYINN